MKILNVELDNFVNQRLRKYFTYNRKRNPLYKSVHSSMAGRIKLVKISNVSFALVLNFESRFGTSSNTSISIFCPQKIREIKFSGRGVLRDEFLQM